MRYIFCTTSLKYGMCFIIKVNLILVLASFQIVNNHMWPKGCCFGQEQIYLSSELI